jgi:tetratricopeptide (TPR) repeat protein
MARKRDTSRGGRGGDPRSRRRYEGRRNGPSEARSADGEANSGSSQLLQLSLCAVLVAATVWAYWPSLDNQLTNWDDTLYILQNPYIDLSFAKLRAIFGSVHYGNYHPLAMLSFAVDHAFGGMEPAVYHRTALALHTLVTLIVFALASQLLRPGPPAFVVALLFGLHPLHVESVAWASGRKDLLFALFLFASLHFYLRHCRDDPKQPGRLFALSLICFILSLLSKAQAVALAPTLVAVDWLLGRKLLEKRVVLEKLPFFALGLGFGVIAIIGQGYDAGQFVGEYVWGIGERFVFACYGYIQYLVLLIAPHGLAAYYPYPHPSETVNGLPLVYLVQVPIVLAWIGVFVWSLRRAPILAFSIAFFTLNIAFVLQLLPIGNVIMADRYTYVPSFGIFLALGAGVDRLQRWPQLRIAVAAIVLVYAAALSAITYRQCDVWQDSASLWDDVLSKYPHAALGLLNRANLRYFSGDLAGARVDLDDMIRLWPDDAKAFGYRAVIRHDTGDVEGAISDMDRAIDLAPSTGFYSNRGGMGVARGDLQGALRDFSRALELNPEGVSNWSKRGWVRGEVGDHRGSLEDYREVVKLAPNRADGHFGIGTAHLRLGELARPSLDRAIALDPSFADAHLRRGELHRLEGRRDAACQDLARAAQLGTDYSGSPLLKYCGG